MANSDGAVDQTRPKQFILFPGRVDRDKALEIAGKVINDHIYGLPLYTADSTKNTKMKLLNNYERLRQSCVILQSNTYDQDQFQSQVKELQGSDNEALRGLFEFIFSPQWSHRGEVITSLSQANPLILYTDLMTTEQKGNIEIMQSNTLETTKKPTMLQQVQNWLGNTQIGELISAGDKVIESIMSGVQIIEGEGNQGQISSGYSQYVQMKNLSKMVVREGLKLWNQGNVQINNKFTFTFRQNNPDNLDEVYIPIFYLLIQQSPNAIYYGYETGQGTTGEPGNAKGLAFSISEKVPPLDLKFSVGNETLIYDHSMITNLDIELYDYKYSKHKILTGQVPTVGKVTIQVESIVPIAQFFHYLSKTSVKDTELEGTKQNDITTLVVNSSTTTPTSSQEPNVTGYTSNATDINDDTTTGPIVLPSGPTVPEPPVPPVPPAEDNPLNQPQPTEVPLQVANLPVDAVKNSSFLPADITTSDFLTATGSNKLLQGKGFDQRKGTGTSTYLVEKDGYVYVMSMNPTPISTEDSKLLATNKEIVKTKTNAAADVMLASNLGVLTGGGYTMPTGVESTVETITTSEGIYIQVFKKFNKQEWEANSTNQTPQSVFRSNSKIDKNSKNNLVLIREYIDNNVQLHKKIDSKGNTMYLKVRQF